MATVTTSIIFNGNCEEAFLFYKSVFGGEFSYFGRFKDMPMPEGKACSPADSEKIMHISLPVKFHNILATLLYVHVIWNPLNIIGVILLLLLGAILFSTFSLIITCLVKTLGRFMGIGQLMTMPLFFANNAIYPIAMMPDWLKIVSHFNPLTYMIDGMRLLMIGIPSGFSLFIDYTVLIVMSTVLILIGGITYKRVII